jgi:hypothetical protein
MASKRPEQTTVFPGKQTAMRTVAKGADLSKLHLHVSLAGSSTVKPSTAQRKGHIKEARLQSKPFKFKRWLAWRQAAIRSIETVCHAYDCASLRRLNSHAASPAMAHSFDVHIRPHSLSPVIPTSDAVQSCLIKFSDVVYYPLLLTMTKGALSAQYSNFSCMIHCYSVWFLFVALSLILPGLLNDWVAASCLLQVPDSWDHAATHSPNGMSV